MTNDLTCTIVFQKNWEAIHALNEDGSRKYRYIVNVGSSRSSKTVSIIDNFDLYGRSQSNKRMTVWRDTKTDCKKTVLNDALKRFKTTGRYKNEQEFNKTESIFTYSTESTLEIHGTDDEETVHGLTQDCAWFNEPYKISKDTFDQIDQRTSDFIILDLNPKKGHWSDDLIKDPRTIVIHSTFKDNPFCPIEQKTKILSYQPIKNCEVVELGLISENEARIYDLEANVICLSKKQVNELSRCRQNEDKNSANEFKWQVYGLGLKAERPHRIFNWKEISLDQYLKIDKQPIIGVDWGKVDPFGILEAKYYDGGLYLRELNYDSENQIMEKLSITDRKQIEADKSDETAIEGGLVIWLFEKLGIKKDIPIICDTNRPLKISALRRKGYEVHKAIKVPGSIIDGIALLENLNVYFTSDSKNLKYEQENYSRQVDRYGIVLEDPEDRDNHQIDPARYIALYINSKLNSTFETNESLSELGINY